MDVIECVALGLFGLYIGYLLVYVLGIGEPAHQGGYQPKCDGLKTKDGKPFVMDGSKGLTPPRGGSAIRRPTLVRLPDGTLYQFIGSESAKLPQGGSSTGRPSKQQ